MGRLSGGQLGRWYGECGDALVLYARQWLGEHAAQDVVQNAFLKLAQQRVPPHSVRAWLFKTVRNAALNEIRESCSRRRHQELIAAERKGWFRPDLDGPLDAAQAQQILRALPDEQREILLLRIWGHMTITEIAEFTDLSLSTVHEKCRSALDAIRRRMMTYERHA